jgi:hypothetical protein
VSGCINRDKNSVNNMEKITEHLIRTCERPEKYRIKKKEVVPTKVTKSGPKSRLVKDRSSYNLAEPKLDNRTKTEQVHIRETHVKIHVKKPKKEIHIKLKM